MNPDAELVERVVQAMDNTFPGVFRSQEDCQDIARAAIQATLTDQAVSSGLKLARVVLDRHATSTNNYGYAQTSDAADCGLVNSPCTGRWLLTEIGHRLVEIVK